MPSQNNEGGVIFSVKLSNEKEQMEMQVNKKLTLESQSRVSMWEFCTLERPRGSF